MVHRCTPNQHGTRTSLQNQEEKNIQYAIRLQDNIRNLINTIVDDEWNRTVFN